MNYKIFLKIIFFAFVGGLSYVYIANQQEIDQYVNSLSTSAQDLYVTDTVDNGLTVHWRTTVADNSVIEVSSNKNFTDVIKNSTPSKKYTFINSISITDLKPESTYYFRISNHSKNFDHRQFSTSSIYPITLYQNYFSLTIPTTVGQYQRAEQPQPLIIDKGVLKYTNDYLITLTNKFEPKRGTISIDSKSGYEIIDISQLIALGSTNQIEYSLLIDSKVQANKIIMIDPADLSLKNRVLFIDNLDLPTKSNLNLIPTTNASDNNEELRFSACCLAPIGQEGQFTGLSVTSVEACKTSAGQYATEQLQSQLTCNQTFNGVCCRADEEVVWVPDFSCSPADTLSDFDYTQCMEKTPMVELHTLSIAESGLNRFELPFTPTFNDNSFQKVSVADFFDKFKDHSEYLCIGSTTSVKWECATNYRGQSIGSHELAVKGNELSLFVTEPFEVSVSGY